MKNSTTLNKLHWTAFFMWVFLFATVLMIKGLPYISPDNTAAGVSLFATTAYADGEGSDGSGGGSDGGGDSSAGSNEASGSSDANGGGCGDCGGAPSNDTPTPDTPSGSVGDFGGSEVRVTYVPTVTPVPQMSGNISASAGACVPGVAKRYVTVSWNTQNAQLSVVQMVSANFGGNLFTPTSNTSGTLNLEYGTGAYKFGIVGGRDGSWVTFKNADLFLNANDCVTPVQPVCPTGTTGTYPNCVVPPVTTWTPYCTGANDPNGNQWQWWEKSNTNPVQYRFLRTGDGSCVPPVGPVCPAGTTGIYPNCVVPQPVCPTGTTGAYPNCIVINNNNNNTNNNTNTNNNVITINTPAPQTQIIYSDSGSRSRSSSRSDYRYNDYGACTITVSPTVVAYGQSTTLSWSSNSGNSGWIEGVGSVAAYGSMQTTPTRSGVYTGRFVGNNGQTITCSAYVTVAGAYVPPAYNTPYVSLASVPYTGLELGPYGTVIYWSFLILWCLFAAYLVAVKKIQNTIANWFVGKRNVSAHTQVAHTHEAHAEHVTQEEAPAHNYREDTVDSFIAQQLKLVQR